MTKRDPTCRMLGGVRKVVAGHEPKKHLLFKVTHKQKIIIINIYFFTRHSVLFSDMCRRYGQAGIPLPNELLSVIINKLASDTEDNDIARAALASCRLTSHVLCSLATPLFFSSMKLTEKLSWANYEDRLETFRARAIKLNQLLTIRHIAASVHTLALRCGEVALTEGTLISRILYRLPHIRCLTFETDHQLEFSLITKGFSSAIHALFKSPNLTTLNLYYVRNFPITDITPNLRCLRLSFTVSCVNSIFSVFSVIANPRCQVNNVNPMDETSSPQPFYLDSLEIDQFSLYSLGVSISHDKSFAKYFSQIKNLQLKDLFSVDALRLGWDIMLLTSQCLATLDLSWNNERKLHLHCG